MTEQMTINDQQFNSIQQAVALFNPNVSIYDMLRMVEDDGSDVVWVEAVDLIQRKQVSYVVDSALVVREA